MRNVLCSELSVRGTVHAVLKIKEQKERETYENEKSNEKASWGGVALAFSMAMAVGIFAGTGMEVKAEENWHVEKQTVPNDFGTVLQDCIIVEDQDVSEAKAWVNEYITAHKDRAILFETKFTAFTSEHAPYASLYYYSKDDNKVVDEGVRSIPYLKTVLNRESLDCYIYILKKGPAPDTTDDSSTTGGDANNTPYTPHTHSYSWVTVQDVNAEQDGIEEYRCPCGDVQERCVLPRYMAIVKGLYGAVKDAPQNGTATFDTGSAFTMTDYVIRKLSERTDVTTVITFKYQNQSYRMTIPAGVDYTSLLSDGDYFYGYFYFANAVGATIEAINL